MKERITKTEQKQMIHQIVWKLHEQGLKQQQIAEAVDYTQANISIILKSIKAQGIDKYEVGSSSGAPSKLTAHQMVSLKKKLKQEAKENGFPTDGWTQKRVQHLIAKSFGVHYARAYISEILAKLDFTLQVPRLRDIRQDEERRRHYKEQVLPALKKNPPKLGTT